MFISSSITITGANIYEKLSKKFKREGYDFSIQHIIIITFFQQKSKKELTFLKLILLF